MDNLCKVVLLGDTKSGKTSIVQMFVDSTFNEAQQTTIGLDFRIRYVDLAFQQIMKISIFDVGGYHRYLMDVQDLKSFIQRGHVAIIVYDVTKHDGLTSIQRWLDFLRENQTENLRTIIVANKMDRIKERVITLHQGIEFSQQLGLPYYEISAQNKRSVDFMFESALRISIQQRQQNPEAIRENQQLLQTLRQQQKSIKVYSIFLVILLFLVIFAVIFILYKVICSNLIQNIVQFDMEQHYITSLVGGIIFTIFSLIFIFYTGLTLKRQ